MRAGLTNMAKGKTITYFMEDGDADGVVSVDLHGWEGNAVVIPRERVGTYKNPELQDTGVYLLLCNAFSGDKSVYIGEAINVQKRLMKHIQDYNAGKEKFYWDFAFAFTAGASLNKGLTQYIENRLTQIATEVGTYNVLTKKTVGGTKLKPSAKSDMETFIDNIRVIVRMQGFYVFLDPEVADPKAGKGSSSKEGKFFCKDAVMRVEDGMYIVEKGSKTTEKLSKVFVAKHGYYKLFLQLQEEKVIVNHEFTQDYAFSSPSAAAAMILGRASNGKTEWKSAEGKTLVECLSK